MAAKTLTDVAVEVHADMSKVKPEVVKQSKDAGEAGGEVLGEGITRGADGKLRDSRGKFVKESEKLGREMGEGAGQGFGDGFERQAPRVVGAGRKLGKDFGKGFDSSFGDTFGKVVATMVAKLTLIGGAAAASTPGVLQLTGALLPATGAALALPVALTALKAASATAKLAVLGVADAIETGFTGTAEEAKEELDKLTGSTRVFAESIIDLKGPLVDVRSYVSDRFFTPLIDEVQPLARLYIPELEGRMGDLAGTLGGLGEQIAQTAQKSIVFAAVQRVFYDARISALNLRGAIDPLTVALSALILTISPKLQELSFGFTSLAGSFRDFVVEAAASGALEAAYDRGAAAALNLFNITGNLIGIFAAFYQAANQGGNDLLTTINDTLFAVRQFLTSAEGFGILAGIFGTLGSVGAELRSGLGVALVAIAQAVTVLGPALAALAPAFVDIATALAPVIVDAASLAASIITDLTPAILAVTGWLAQNDGVLKALLITLAAYKVMLQVVSAIAAVQAAGGLIAWFKGLTLVTNITRIATVVQYAFGAAIRFAMGPIGIVITLIGLLVAAIVWLWQNNETFRNIVMQVWEAIKVAIAATVDWIVNTAWPAIQAAWDAIAKAAIWLWEVVLKPVFDAWMWYVQNIVIPAVLWLWEKAFKPAFNWISWIVKSVMAGIELYIRIVIAFWKNVVFPAAMWLWEKVFRPVFEGVRMLVEFNIKASMKVVEGLVWFFKNVLAPAAMWLWKNVMKPVWDGFKMLVVGNIEISIKFLKMLVGYLKDQLVSGFRSSVDLIKRAWDGLKEVARKPIAFVVNSVINPLIGGFNSIADIFGSTRISPITGFADGGQIPGSPSRRGDNRLASNGRGIFGIATGEFVTNVMSTLANLPLLNVINRKRGKVGLGDILPALGGYAGGGAVTTSAPQMAGDPGGFMLAPFRALVRMLLSALTNVPGAGLLRDVTIGMARRLAGDMGGMLSGFGGKANGGMVGPAVGARMARADFGSVTLQRGWNLVENATGQMEPLKTPDDRVEALLERILAAVEANPPRFAAAMGGTTTGMLREARRF